MSIQEEINSRELVLQNLVESGESGQVSYLLQPERERHDVKVATKCTNNHQVGLSSNVVVATEYEDADNEASETDFPTHYGNKERLSSQDSWESSEKDPSRSSGSSWVGSDDTTADSGNCDSPTSYDSDRGLREGLRGGLRSATEGKADSSSINSTTDSALSSMISSENEYHISQQECHISQQNEYHISKQEKFKTLTKKRVQPSWRNSRIDVNTTTSDARESRVTHNINESPLGGELSCEDDNAPFCNSEYIRKIRKNSRKFEKSSRMFNPDTKILETSERIFRSASINRRANHNRELKRSQSLKTVETLV